MPTHWRHRYSRKELSGRKKEREAMSEDAWATFWMAVISAAILVMIVLA